MSFICKKSHYSDLWVEKSCQISTVPLTFTNDYIMIIKSNPDFSRDHAILIFLSYLGLKRSGGFEPPTSQPAVECSATEVHSRLLFSRNNVILKYFTFTTLLFNIHVAKLYFSLLLYLT